VASLGASESSRDVLVVQPADASGGIVGRLTAQGWRPRAIGTYRTEVDDSSVDAGKQALDEGIDAVLFTSGSTVRSFVQLWGLPPDTATICCIGPRTAEACTTAGVRVDAVASEQTIDSLVDALVRIRQRKL
jgi:uroporphyrinogen III methyltransferase/synthase